MRKKSIISVVLFVLVIGLLSACGTNDTSVTTTTSTESSQSPKVQESQSGKQEEATLKFVWGNMEDKDKQIWMDYIFTPFQEKYPHIKVDFQPIPNVADTIKVQVASGGGPDMFMIDAFDVKDFAQAGRLLDMDTYVKQYGWDKIIYPWALDVAKYDGKQYAIPNEYESTMMYYNKDLLDKNGWPVPKTRAEFEKVSSEAKAKGIIPIAYGNASLIAANQFLYEHYITTYGGVNAVKELFQGKIKFTDPKIKGAFELLNADWQKGWWNDKNSTAITPEQARSLFYSQKALFNSEGTWMQTEFAKGVANFNWGATSWPSMKEGVPSASSIGVGAVIAVNKNTKYPDAAAQLIDFIYTSVELRAQGVAKGLQPLSRDNDPALYPKDINENSFKVLNAMKDVTADPNNVSYTPWTFYPTKTNQYLYDNLDKVFYGKLTLDNYLNKAQETLDADLKAGFQFAIK
jgi:raffinose/stachyose/melibiose transport system substrate-binding protein